MNNGSIITARRPVRGILKLGGINKSERDMTRHAIEKLFGVHQWNSFGVQIWLRGSWTPNLN